MPGLLSDFNPASEAGTACFAATPQNRAALALPHSLFSLTLPNPSRSHSHTHSVFRGIGCTRLRNTRSMKSVVLFVVLRCI